MHKGFTLWFTGMSGAGKSTISRAAGGAPARPGRQGGGARWRRGAHASFEGPGLRQRGPRRKHPPHRLRLRAALAQWRDRHRGGHFALPRGARRGARPDRQVRRFRRGLRRMPHRGAGRARRQGPLQESAGRRAGAVHGRVRSVRAAARARGDRELVPGNARGKRRANLGYTGTTGSGFL